MQTLFALSMVFLLLVIINGLFKFYINTYKGRLGERLLRRIRFELVDRILRFPPSQFKRMKGAEVPAWSRMRSSLLAASPAMPSSSRRCLAGRP
jgi:ABC-type bacteriocin/lantibiotic exporter with double-glycine peptidase domain